MTTRRRAHDSSRHLGDARKTVRDHSRPPGSTPPAHGRHARPRFAQRSRHAAYVRRELTNCRSEPSHTTVRDTSATHARRFVTTRRRPGGTPRPRQTHPAPVRPAVTTCRSRPPSAHQLSLGAVAHDSSRHLGNAHTTVRDHSPTAGRHASTPVDTPGPGSPSGHDMPLTSAERSPTVAGGRRGRRFVTPRRRAHDSSRPLADAHTTVRDHSRPPGSTPPPTADTPGPGSPSGHDMPLISAEVSPTVAGGRRGRRFVTHRQRAHGGSRPLADGREARPAPGRHARPRFAQRSRHAAHVLRELTNCRPEGAQTTVRDTSATHARRFATTRRRPGGTPRPR
ncbi:hypothetical protein EDF19_2981 [Curtobacterium sp. PhB115]|nr:hypothetical protein EDF19_2981 [Curtobacterium sp. PhB115]